jgi:predicted metal-binding transcription factor (methanogenesis marker protein 9)
LELCPSLCPIKKKLKKNDNEKANKKKQKRKEERTRLEKGKDRCPGLLVRGGTAIDGSR